MYLCGIKQVNIMRNLTLLFVFLAVVACGRAQGFLTPANIRSTDILEILLMNGVRITNHYGQNPEWFLSMGTYYVSAPSFSPEYALIIRENELVLNKATTVLQHSIYSKQRMQDPDFRKLDKETQKDMREMARKLENNPVKSYSLPISKEMRDQLAALFEHATMTATHLESRALGNDGTLYYFNHDRKMGYVWTPFGGRMWRLVNMADSLCYAVENQDSEVLKRQMKVCENLTKSFKKEYPLSYFKPTGFSCSSNAEKGPWHCEIAGFPNDECMWLEVLSDSAVSGEICSNVLRQYTDSLTSWSREIFLISDNPIYPSIVIDNHADTAICVAKQYERYTSREITIPEIYWRREVILSAAQLPPGRYYFAEGEWREYK